MKCEAELELTAKESDVHFNFTGNIHESKSNSIWYKIRSLFTFNFMIYVLSVAIKVLRPDAAQGRSQFQQEVQNFISDTG